MPDINELRRQEKIAAAFSIPAASYFARPAEVSNHSSSDSISKSSVSEVSAKRSIPVLDAPEDAGSDILKLGIQGLDDLLHALYLASEEVLTDRLAINRTFLESERKISDEIEKERMEAIKKDIADSKNVSAWNTLEKSLSALGLIAAGIATLGAGAALMGTAAIGTGVLLLIDRFLDDAANKTVAAWVARGDQEDELRWRERLHFLCAATSFALSVGLAPQAAIRFGMSAAKASVTGVKTFYEWRANNKRAFMLELEAASNLSQKNINRIISDMQLGCSDLYRLHDIMHKVQERERSVGSAMLSIPGR
ncbi:MAG: hypothetical protein JSR37_09615 [Verrucomicrobia bacterium]|nr:hypothetical protein [Verrucomicrobiota bacterium]MBS0636513.1 hypothetical protein [Verrucomicrobiota bacterium]